MCVFVVAGMGGTEEDRKLLHEYVGWESEDFSDEEELKKVREARRRVDDAGKGGFGGNTGTSNPAVPPSTPAALRKFQKEYKLEHVELEVQPKANHLRQQHRHLLRATTCIRAP